MEKDIPVVITDPIDWEGTTDEVVVQILDELFPYLNDLENNLGDLDLTVEENRAISGYINEMRPPAESLHEALSNL